MNSIFSIWFDDEAAGVFSYLIAYCLCYLAFMYVLDHFGKSSPTPMAGYTAAALTPTQLPNSVVKVKNE